MFKRNQIGLHADLFQVPLSDDEQLYGGHVRKELVSPQKYFFKEFFQYCLAKVMPFSTTSVHLLLF